MVKKKISWKQKKQYRILAPRSFDLQEIGITVASNPDTLIGRTIGVSLMDLSGDKTKQHVKLLFEITRVEGDDAKTKFKKVQLNQSYVRSKIKKGMSKIDCVNTIQLSNTKVWVKVVVITQKLTQTSRVKDISVRIAEILNSHKNLKLSEFLQLALFGKLGTEIYHQIKKITPIKRVEIEAIKRL
jgi:small subunit ribosomal protein S3Ae